MQLILLFASACTASGSWLVYSFFQGTPSLLTLPQIFSSVLPLGVLLSATGLGLFTRRPWAPTVALAVWIVGVFYSFAAVAILMSNGVLMSLFREGYAPLAEIFPVIVSHALEIVLLVSVGGLILLGMMFRLIGNLRSADTAEFYDGEEHWLGYPLYVGYWNVKPLVLSLPMFFIVHLNLWLPQAMPVVAERSGIRQPVYLSSAKKLMEVALPGGNGGKDTVPEETLPKDKSGDGKKAQQSNDHGNSANAKLLKLSQAGDKSKSNAQGGGNDLPAFMDPKKKPLNGKQKVEFAKFTPIGNFLWVFTSNHKLHLFDLKNFTSKSWVTQSSFFSEEESLLSSDGKFFYDNKKKRLIATETGQELPVHGKLDERTYAMLGFSSPSTLALIYRYSSDMLELIDTTAQIAVWSKPFGFQDLIIKGGLLLENLWWSGDRQFLIHRSNTRFYLLDLKDGSQQELRMDIAAPKFVASVGDEMVLSGPGLNNLKPKTYLVQFKNRTAQEIGEKFPSTHFDFKAKKAFQVGLNEMQIVDAKLPPGTPPASLKLPILAQVAGIPGTPWFYFVYGQERQVQLYNANTFTQRGIGRVYSNTRRPDPKVTYVTSSDHGLVFMATRHEAEIFYPSQVTVQVPKTWAFEIPFDSASVGP